MRCSKNICNDYVDKIFYLWKVSLIVIFRFLSFTDASTIIKLEIHSDPPTGRGAQTYVVLML